jgi:hypothetical protein
MTLEKYIAELNSLAFWSEFTFDQNKFSPASGTELELADCLVWFGRHAIALQLKERTDATEDQKIERAWFENKVIRKGTKQVRDTIRYLSENKKIKVTNRRNHTFEISINEIDNVTKVIVYLGGKHLPEDCWATRHYVSDIVGFIHVIAAHDYLGILEKLRVPEDIKRYFKYREQAILKLSAEGTDVAEPDIMGAFLSEEPIPTADSHFALAKFLQDFEQFDLSWLLGNLHKHIQTSTEPNGYYKIMQEFAVIPRSMWREIKLRVQKSLEAVQARQFCQPYRVADPTTLCTFMICPLDPDIPSSGPESEVIRIRGLRQLTDGAMYDMKMSKGIGLVISKDGEYFQLDWVFIDLPWKFDAAMEKQLEKNNPFRPVTERNLASFLFLSD